MPQISAKQAIKELNDNYNTFGAALSHIKRLFPFSDVDGTAKEPYTPTLTDINMVPMVIGSGESLEGFYIDKNYDWDKTKPGKPIYKYTVKPRIDRACSFMFVSTIPNHYMVDPTLEIK